MDTGLPSENAKNKEREPISLKQVHETGFGDRPEGFTPSGRL
jgi:hypothetical protein